MSDGSVGVPVTPPDVGQKQVDCDIVGGVYRQRVVSLSYGYHSPSGENRPVGVYDGHLNTTLFLDSVGMNKIAGHVKFGGFGQRNDCSTSASGDDCWEGVSTTCPIPNQTTGEQLTLVSTSAADDGSPVGTGILTLDVHGLDIDGNPQSEIVTMNGVTPVNTVRINWRFNQSIHMETVGTGGVAAGTISVYRTGDATRVYNVITPGGNMSMNAARMVPAGKIFYLKARTVTASSSKTMSIRQRATTTFEDVLTNGFAYLFKQPWLLFNAGITEVLPIPEKYPEFSIVKATAYSVQAGGGYSFSYGGWYE